MKSWKAIINEGVEFVATHKANGRVTRTAPTHRASETVIAAQIFAETSGKMAASA